MKITISKKSSCTKNIPLPDEVTISKNIPAIEGTLIVAKVLENKKNYNQLELVNGRMSTLRKNDIIAVALGNRQALKGFVGEIPTTVQQGDTLNVLNIGGVAGKCISENLTAVGHALKIEVLGSIEHNGIILNINQNPLFPLAQKLESDIPIIVVSGTCMNVGKTSVASEVIASLSQNGKKIFSTKLAGVACLRDTEQMKDYGALQAVSFLDAGLTSTVHQDGKSVFVTKGALNFLSQQSETPDYIVIEFGDGVFGEYGVKEILEDPEIQKNIILHIGCAHDPMGAVKLFEECEKIGTPLHCFSGPVTDNSVGRNFIAKHTGISGFNALHHQEDLYAFLSQTLCKK